MSEKSIAIIALGMVAIVALTLIFGRVHFSNRNDRSATTFDVTSNSPNNSDEFLQLTEKPPSNTPTKQPGQDVTTRPVVLHGVTQ